MRVILFILFFSSTLFSQVNSINSINGVLYYESGLYFVLDEGYLKINGFDPYEEYYRKIYNDSTIVNPNTVITNNYDLNLIPFLNLTGKYKEYLFDQPINIGLFLDFNNPNQFLLTPYGKNFIDSLMVNEKNMR